jgi:outer membrane receptor protein involved in Fe transport
VRKQFPFRKKLLAALITSAVATTFAAPTIAWAQSATATLGGKAPPSSEVTAKNIATGNVRRTKAASDGSYTLVGLQPGTYQVDAGPGTTTTVTLTVASTATLDLQPAGAVNGGTTTLEGITVSGTTLRDVKTPEVGSTISLHEIQTIPQVSRNFLEFADTVPGMVFSVDSSGHASLQGGAQNTSSVNVYIDGVGQKDYVKEGGVSGQFASQGNPFPQLAIGEYKVITSNYKAEYDQISSAAVVAETKSGTNEFHGELFNTYTDDGYRADTPSEKAAGVKTPSQEKDYGFALGGPIIQDTLHFFFTYEAKQFDTPVTVTPGVTNVNGVFPAGLLPASVQSQLGPADLPFSEDLYFGKLDWEFSDRDRIELSAKVRKEDQIDNIGVAQAKSASIDVINNDTRFDARWQHSADNWFNDLLFTYEKAFNAPSSQGLGNGSIYTYYESASNNPQIIDVGPASPLATQNKGQKGPGIQDDLTFTDLHWMGDHTVKMGAKYKEVTLTAQDAEDINPQFYYDVTPGGTATIPYKAFFTNPVPGLNPIATTKDKQFGTYIQDDWALNDKLTLNLGIRWDYENNPSYLNYVTPASVVAAYNSQDPNAPPGQTYAQSLAKGGVNINDYISTGHNRSAYTGEWQPRLGFSYDLNSDEQHVIHGGLGRAYDRDLYDYLQLEETKSALPELTVNFPSALHPCTISPTCVAFNPIFLNGLSNLQSLVAGSNAGQEVDALNNNLKAPYSDQISLGMRNKIGDWNTDATVARIVSKNGFVFTLGNRYPNGAFFMNGGQPWGNGIPGFGSLIIGNNGIETRTNQLLLSLDKPYTKESGWGVTFAYTYTDATQNRDISQHYAFDEETIQQYPFITSNAASKHRFVAAGSLDGPGGFTYGAKVTLATPIPVNDIACYGATFPTGSGCTPIAGTSQGESVGFGGKIFGFRTVDLQATKDFDFTQGIHFQVRVDFINVFNFKNYADTINNWGGGGVLNTVNPVVYNPTGNITGYPRMLRLSAFLRF